MARPRFDKLAHPLATTLCAAALLLAASSCAKSSRVKPDEPTDNASVTEAGNKLPARLAVGVRRVFEDRALPAGTVAVARVDLSRASEVLPEATPQEAISDAKRLSRRVLAILTEGNLNQVIASKSSALFLPGLDEEGMLTVAIGAGDDAELRRDLNLGLVDLMPSPGTMPFGALTRVHLPATDAAVLANSLRDQRTQAILLDGRLYLNERLYEMTKVEAREDHVMLELRARWTRQLRESFGDSSQPPELPDDSSYFERDSPAMRAFLNDDASLLSAHLSAEASGALTLSSTFLSLFNWNIHLTPMERGSRWRRLMLNTMDLFLLDDPARYETADAMFAMQPGQGRAFEMDLIQSITPYGVAWRERAGWSRPAPRVAMGSYALDFNVWAPFAALEEMPPRTRFLDESAIKAVFGELGSDMTDVLFRQMLQTTFATWRLIASLVDDRTLKRTERLPDALAFSLNAAGATKSSPRETKRFGVTLGYAPDDEQTAAYLKTWLGRVADETPLRRDRAHVLIDHGISDDGAQAHSTIALDETELAEPTEVFGSGHFASISMANGLYEEASTHLLSHLGAGLFNETMSDPARSAPQMSLMAFEPGVYRHYALRAGSPREVTFDLPEPERGLAEPEALPDCAVELVAANAKRSRVQLKTEEQLTELLDEALAQIDRLESECAEASAALKRSRSFWQLYAARRLDESRGAEAAAALYAESCALGRQAACEAASPDKP